MEMNFGDIKAETIRGTEAESVYMVIAENKGLRLAIRPLLEGIPRSIVDGKPGDNRLTLMLGARLRVVPVEGGDGNVGDAEAAFGILGFHDKGKHASQVIGITLAPLPCGVDEARLRWKEAALTGRLVATLLEHLSSVGVESPLSPFAIEAWLDQDYENKLPETPPVNISNELLFDLATL